MPHTYLAMNQTIVFDIKAETLFSEDVLLVNKGELYRFWCDNGQKWKDWFYTTSPDGYFNPLVWLFGARLTTARCFCLCGVYDHDDDTAFAIGSDSTVKIQMNGTVSFFANDAIWAYGNNSGAIKLNISRLQ